MLFENIDLHTLFLSNEIAPMSSPTYVPKWPKIKMVHILRGYQIGNFFRNKICVFGMYIKNAF